MTRVLVSAASRHGSTAEIGEAIARTLSECEIDADAVTPKQVDVTSDYDAFVIGSALYAGHWLEDAVDLCQRLGPELGDHPVWLFSSGPVGPEDSGLAKKMWTDPVDLEQVQEATKAVEHRMFAGRLNRSELGRLQRAALFFFKQLEGDYRDWNEISAFSNEIAAALGATDRLSRSDR
jgi:menaquinone-dependent protoporphyrinogen oxidase